MALNVKFAISCKIALLSLCAMTARMSLAGSLSAFGLGTTGLLNFFVKPYVHSLKYDGSGKVLEVETLDFFARKRLTELKLDDVEGGAKDSMHPLSTFVQLCVVQLSKVSTFQKSNPMNSSKR